MNFFRKLTHREDFDSSTLSRSQSQSARQSQHLPREQYLSLTRPLVQVNDDGSETFMAEEKSQESEANDFSRVLFDGNVRQSSMGTNIPESSAYFKYPREFFDCDVYPNDPELIHALITEAMETMELRHELWDAIYKLPLSSQWTFAVSFYRKHLIQVSKGLFFCFFFSFHFSSRLPFFFFSFYPGIYI
ncbi:hypothetical protein HMI56_000797 [Coelomomyces lativittatus]|nr:hypothetical protein HMI56_000797 [Coelomomyces lativittatus]